MKKIENAKQTFIESAVRVVARDGLDKTTTKAIAADAGLNEAYIYRCFERGYVAHCISYRRFKLRVLSQAKSFNYVQQK